MATRRLCCEVGCFFVFEPRDIVCLLLCVGCCAGSNFNSTCASTSVLLRFIDGSMPNFPLALVSCNTSVFVALSPAGYGVGLELVVSVNGQSLTWPSAFSYQAPSISGLVRGLLMYAMVSTLLADSMMMACRCCRVGRCRFHRLASSTTGR